MPRIKRPHFLTFWKRCRTHGATFEQSRNLFEMFMAQDHFTWRSYIDNWFNDDI